MVGLYFFSNELNTYLIGRESIPSPVRRIRHYSETYYLSNPFVYVIFFGIANSLFVPGFILAVAAGLLFNPYVGFTVTMAGLLLASQTFYWLGRIGDDTVLNLFSESILDLIYKYLPRRTGWVVFLCRLVFFMPFHAFNAVCGVLRIQVLPFLLATGFGLAPRMFVYFYIGVSLGPNSGNITTAGVYLILLVVIESLYGGVLLQTYLRKQRKNS